MTALTFGALNQMPWNVPTEGLSEQYADLQAAETLVGLIKAGHPSLSKLDVTCNLIGADAGLQLREAVESNQELVMDLDVRACEVAQDDEAAISEILRNRSLRGSRPFAWLTPTSC